MPVLNFMPHQQQALDQTESFNRCAYYLDMGLGKTFVGAEKMYLLNNDVNLVVCQKSKIDDWVDHFEKYYPDYEVFNLTKKTQVVRFRELIDTSTIYDYKKQIVGVINYDLVYRRPYITHIKDFTLMLDESSLIQNETTRRAKFILRLQPESVVLLSGTPTSGKYEKLNNMYDDFTEYDFTGAEISNIKVSLSLSGKTEAVSKGVFTVNDTSYDGDIITLECLDNMHKFDVNYSKSNLTYPATLLQIVQDACRCCGVTLATDSLQFEYYNYVIQKKPDNNTMTFRDVLTWVGQISGHFWKCNKSGQLSAGWYNMSDLSAGRNIHTLQTNVVTDVNVDMDDEHQIPDQLHLSIHESFSFHMPDSVQSFHPLHLYEHIQLRIFPLFLIVLPGIYSLLPVRTVL